MDYISYYKQMRIILLYDLPMKEDDDRKIYSKFHKNLENLGFYMLQYSIYVKVVPNEVSYKQVMGKMNDIVPTKGNVIIFRMTEKQFQDMKILRGGQNKFEMMVGGKELVYFGGDEL